MEAVADNADPRPLGHLLAAERERQGLSRAEIAQRLHMSAWQVEALEAGDFARLPKGTFLRGFVRNYAKALGVDPDSVLARIEERAPRPGIVVPSQNIRFDPIGERLANPYVKAAALSVVVIAVGFAAMYWWLFIRPTPPGGIAKKAVTMQGPPPQIAAAPVAPPEPVVAVPAPSEPAKPEPAAAPAKTEPKPEAPKVQPAAAVKASSGKVIKLRFRGESWVEIKDGQGKVLLSQINAPGSETQVSGRPPLTIVVGNAPDVQMLVNDREFSLEPHTKVAVARFTLE